MRVYVITVLVAVLASVVQVAYAPVLPRACDFFSEVVCSNMRQLEYVPRVVHKMA